MKRVINVDKEYKCNATKAIEKFFKSYPDLEYWKDSFEWMAENDKDTVNDTVLGDGTYNREWRYSLLLDQYDGSVTYLAVIERA